MNPDNQETLVRHSILLCLSGSHFAPLCSLNVFLINPPTRTHAEKMGKAVGISKGLQKSTFPPPPSPSPQVWSRHSWVPVPLFTKTMNFSPQGSPPHSPYPGQRPKTGEWVSCFEWVICESAATDEWPTKKYSRTLDLLRPHSDSKWRFLSGFQSPKEFLQSGSEIDIIYKWISSISLNSIQQEARSNFPWKVSSFCNKQKVGTPRVGEDPLEKGMATYSSILTWSIPWTEEPGGLQSMGSQRARHNWVTESQLSHMEEHPELNLTRTTTPTLGFLFWWPVILHYNH